MRQAVLRSAVCNLLSAGGKPPCGRPSAVCRLHSAVCNLPPAVCRLPPEVSRLQTVCLQSAVCRLSAVSLLQDPIRRLTTSPCPDTAAQTSPFVCDRVEGLLRELNPGPLGPKPRVIPLDQAAANRLLRSSASGVCSILHGLPPGAVGAVRARDWVHPKAKLGAAATNLQKNHTEESKSYHHITTHSSQHTVRTQEQPQQQTHHRQTTKQTRDRPQTDPKQTTDTLQTDTNRPQTDHRQTRDRHTDEPQTDNKQTTNRPQPDYRQTRDRPQTDHRQTKNRHQTDHKQTTHRQQTNPRPQTDHRRDPTQTTNKPQTDHKQTTHRSVLVFSKHWWRTRNKNKKNLLRFAEKLALLYIS